MGMEMEQAKIRKQKAEKRIRDILLSLQDDTGLDVTELDFYRYVLADTHDPVQRAFDFKIRLRMEL